MYTSFDGSVPWRNIEAICDPLNVVRQRSNLRDPVAKNTEENSTKYSPVALAINLLLGKTNLMDGRVLGPRCTGRTNASD